MRQRAASLFGRFLRSTSGQFALMTAITAPAAVVLAAVAVDSGSLYVEKRRAQALADLAAIAAASNIDKAPQQALAMLSDNGVSATIASNTGDFAKPGGNDRIVVTTGRYKSDKSLDPADRYTANAPLKNAARVTYRTIGTRYFAGSIIPAPEIIVTATAASTPAAAFSIGSRLAAVNDGILNALLKGLTGSQISLTVMDYNALLNANVSLLDFLDALALEVGLTAGSYEEVLDTQVTIGQVAKALKNSGGSGALLAPLGKLVNALTNGSVLPIKLSDIIDFGDGQLAQAALRQIGADVNVMEILMLSAILAGKGKQVGLDLGVQTGGLLDVSVSLAIGEPPQRSPWFAVGEAGTLVRTAQTRLTATVDIGMPGSLLSLLGTRIRLPLYLEVAFAEAQLKSITCPTGRRDSLKVQVDARPGVVNLFLAEVDKSKLGNFGSPMARSTAKLVQVPLVSITGQAHAEMSNIAYKTLTFTAADIDSGKVRKVNTKDYVTSLTTSLFSSLSLTANVELGLLNLPLLTLPSNTLALLGQAIKGVAQPIDNLLYTLLSALGVSLGEAEIKVHGATCGRAVLVQ